MFSLIIPTYNERENILSLLEQVAKALKGREYEVIVVDDNSPDQTWKAVEEYQTTHPWIRLKRRLNKRGLSSAVLEAFEIANGDIFGVMDADHSHDPELLPKMIHLIENKQADCVIGSRRIAGGGIQDWSWHRKFSSFCATFLAHQLTGLRTQDPMSGFFCITRDTFLSVSEKVKAKGYKILLEILAKARGIRVVEVPYIFKDRKQGRSKLSPVVIMQYLQQVADLFFYRARNSA